MRQVDAQICGRSIICRKLTCYLKGHPDRSAIRRRATHLAASRSRAVKALIGTSMQYVPYRGTDAIWPDLLTGPLLNCQINAGLSDPAVKARLADLGAAPFFATAAETRHSSPTKT